jgi:flagellar protein FlbD
MITLTKIDGATILVNCEEIESAESFHDTTISFKNGKKIVVRESYSEITEKVIDYKRRIFEQDKTITTNS